MWLHVSYMYFGYPILDTTISILRPRQESSGWRPISSIGKTKRVAFFLLQRTKILSKFSYFIFIYGNMPTYFFSFFFTLMQWHLIKVWQVPKFIRHIATTFKLIPHNYDCLHTKIPARLSFCWTNWDGLVFE